MDENLPAPSKGHDIAPRQLAFRQAPDEYQTPVRKDRCHAIPLINQTFESVLLPLPKYHFVGDLPPFQALSHGKRLLDGTTEPDRAEPDGERDTEPTMRHPLPPAFTQIPRSPSGS